MSSTVTTSKLLSRMGLKCKEVAIRHLTDHATVKIRGYVIYSGYNRLRTDEATTPDDRQTLSGSGSPKNKVFQTAYFSNWKVEFTVTFALIFCLAPTEGVA